MLFADIAEVSLQVAATSSRSAKVDLISSLLRPASIADARVAVTWLSGDLPQRQIGVGWAALARRPDPAASATLTVAAVDSALSQIKIVAGSGSQPRRRDLLTTLFASATEPEQRFLLALLSGSLRQGALVGVMTEAIARAAAVSLEEVRRAAMLTGDLAETAALALGEGSAGLAATQLRVGRPISPMLAQTATSVEDAIAKLSGSVLWQYKLDGIRIQAHKSGTDIALFTRTLDDVTARMPEIVAQVAAVPARELVIDSEVLTMRADGRPQPFQSTASRTGTRRTDAQPTAKLTMYPFDLLHLDGNDLLTASTIARVDALDTLLTGRDRLGQLTTDDPASAGAFLNSALAAGHEGVVAKALDAPYEAGRRGATWLKIKPVHTLDLVVLAVEWGSGRRTGWLSNIHLGAVDADRADRPDRFVMLGKTFKGMTDEMLRWQTQHFLELAIGPTDGRVVALRPEQVVEIAFDGVQRSSRYPGGVALRFARVLRYRDDKAAGDADTLEAVRAFLPG